MLNRAMAASRICLSLASPKSKSTKAPLVSAGGAVWAAVAAENRPGAISRAQAKNGRARKRVGRRLGGFVGGGWGGAGLHGATGEKTGEGLMGRHLSGFDNVVKRESNKPFAPAPVGLANGQNASEPFGYLETNRDSLPNYGKRYRARPANLDGLHRIGR